LYHSENRIDRVSRFLNITPRYLSYLMAEFLCQPDREGGREKMANQSVIQAEAMEDHATAKTVATGASAEAVAGAGALVLAILGLAGVYPAILMSIGAIAAGAAFLFQGAAAAARHTMLLRESGTEHPAMMETGLSAEIVGGLASVVLGILALIGIASMTLLSISAIVFGATLLFGSPAVYTIGKANVGSETTAGYVMRESAAGAAGAQALVGIGAITLGILALVGFVPQTLVLVSVLAVGASALLSGGAITGKMVSMLYH
jgi:hypothetical protein